MVEASEVVSIPSNVSFAQAAAATDSVATAYHAVVCVAGVDSETGVGIIGLGGLGVERSAGRCTGWEHGVRH